MALCWWLMCEFSDPSLCIEEMCGYGLVWCFSGGCGWDVIWATSALVWLDVGGGQVSFERFLEIGVC